MQKQEEILNGQTGGTLTPGKEEQLFKIHEIQDTPFTIVETDEGFCATMGNNRLTDFAETYQEVYDYIQNKSWDILLKFVLIIINSKETLNSQITKDNKL